MKFLLEFQEISAGGTPTEISRKIPEIISGDSIDVNTRKILGGIIREKSREPHQECLEETLKG